MAAAPLLRGAAAAGLAVAAARCLPWLAGLGAWKRAGLVLLAAYLPGYLDRSEYKAAPRRSAAFSRRARAFFRAVIPRIFNVRGTVLEAPQKLAACKQCILAVHPHGVLSLDHLLTVAGFDEDLERALPQSNRSALSAGVLFKIPFVRELGLWTGCVDAGRSTADACLKAGLSLSVVPGGEREQLLAQRGPLECLVLKERKGFVKLALRHGVPLVPSYCFGEAQLYDQSRLFMGFRSWVQRVLGVALVLPFGPKGVPGLPFPAPLRYVVGAPLEMPQIAEPSRAEVDEHHARYTAELEKLFARHQEAAGYGHVKLELL